MEPPPPINRNGPSYPSQSPASATVPSSLPGSAKAETPEPQPTNTIVDGRKYSLEIAQEPVRARMCGFGDKDRRPITPPPCIRLIVQDANPPYNEIDINNIDTSFFVLTVDLWNDKGNTEVNLVRHSQTSPSISAATSASYPPPNMLHNPYNLPTGYLSGPAFNPVMPNNMMPQQGYPTSSMGYSHPVYQPPQPMYHAQQSIAPPTMYPPQNPGYYTTHGGTPITPAAYYAMQQQGPLLSPQHLPTGLDPRGTTSTPSGMFTRNLIGSLGVSAFKLTDSENALGIWFILQDLSVRTEGVFRLKMNFVNVGSPTDATSLNNGSAPVLASCFSQIFQVFSAKKFPGVIESTDLSRCFATQGIKIPIRKDGPRGNAREDDEEG
ncbi:MAG: hypothetical protein LQ352_006924 [Teloschistes flavicans]|nr:MAG: hypothetical protein LQ352_006924 [Teloschistes flavicans]